MYEIGQQVVYGIHGVCSITGTESRRIDRKDVEYYILEPTLQPGTCYYVPMHNPAALAKLRSPISRVGLEDAFVAAKQMDYCWNQDENQRKMRYRELISTADCKELIQTVRLIHIHKAEQFALGKKFHLCDENFLRDAERLLCGELSVVLEIPAADVPEFIRNMFCT